MSSYNIVNGAHASENYDTLTAILRGEWGFKGMVTTDWGAHSTNYIEVMKGNDIKMPEGEQEKTMQALADGKITRAQLEQAARRVLEMILKVD